MQRVRRRQILAKTAAGNSPMTITWKNNLRSLRMILAHDFSILNAVIALIAIDSTHYTC